MIVYHAKELEATSPRVHPWSVAESDSSHVYVDFKREPERIESALEDFRPYAHQPCIKRFYSLLRWLNGEESLLESNDCAFLGPQPNTDKQFPFQMKCSGRLMILFRHIEENTQDKSINWLCDALWSSIESEESSFAAGAIGLSRMPVGYRMPNLRPTQAALGKQVMLSFWAYGNDAAQAFTSGDVVIRVIDIAIQKASSRIAGGEVDALYEARV